MANMLEVFFNWQTDMDWAWGPFLPLRPPRDSPMTPWVWVRLFAVFTLLGGLLSGAAGVGCVFGPRLAAQQHWSVPPPVLETLTTLAAMGADPSFRRLLLGLALCLPPLFFFACLPFHVAWNRRAARLSSPALSAQAAEKEGPEDTKGQAAIWPPAPRQP